MRQLLFTLTPALLVGGCSWLYNPSNILKPDALADGKPDVFMQADARVATPIPKDAAPSMLTIAAVAPSEINDGAGDWMAVLVHAAVDMTAATDSGTTPLTVQVNEAGAPGPVTLTGMLSLQNLPQLAIANNAVLDVTMLAPLYSQVTGTGTATFSGDPDHQAVIRSVSSIIVGTLQVKGGAAVKDTKGLGGAGGCDGGGVASTGGCSGFTGPGGGGAGLGGGGGGGTAAGAGGGIGSCAGSAGGMAGYPLVVFYVSDAYVTNRGNGGGGGGMGTVLLGGLAGGAGGGGGGTLELDAGGDIAAVLDASGGTGGNAQANEDTGGDA